MLIAVGAAGCEFLYGVGDLRGAESVDGSIKADGRAPATDAATVLDRGATAVLDRDAAPLHATECDDGLCDQGDRGQGAVVAVSAGVDHACALTAAGTVLCWGLNEQGQLGHDPTKDPLCNLSEEGNAHRCSTTPTAIELAPGAPLVGVAELAAGNHFTCARLRNGRVACWGENGSGQLGHAGGDDWCDNVACNSVPKVIHGLLNVSSLAVSADQPVACAVSDGAVLCWGKRMDGIQGDGNPDGGTAVDVDAEPRPTMIQARAVEVAVGAPAYACVRLDDRSVWCWGSNLVGELGHTSGNPPDAICQPTRDPCNATPQRIESVAQADHLALGDGHVCVRSAGKVRCWGGSGFAVAPTPSSLLNPLHDVLDVATTWRHACVRMSDGYVNCWGEDSKAQCGQGTLISPEAGSAACRFGLMCWPEPKPVALHGPARLLATGASASFAVLEDGSLWGWGDNRFGQLGTPGEVRIACSDGTTSQTCYPSPVRVALP